jgi:MoaA/NifB/PqqE/SkfB family radical SAM enzyme
VNYKAFLNTLSVKAYTLPIVILYVTEGCNLRCATCSYREAAPGELTLEEIKKLANELYKFGLKHIVYSGGEPLLRRDFVNICEVFEKLHVKQSLLTNGLLLEKRVEDIQKFFREIIVSIDGADDATHNSIRGLNSFDQILKGIKRAVASPQRNCVSIRTVIQKRNYRQLPEMIELAKSLGVDRISFLSADVFSDSFGRDTRGYADKNENILLSHDETIEFRKIIEDAISRYKEEFDNKFISESPDKMFRILKYFEASIGKSDYPINTCNAPMVSAVITSTGNILPCYFLPSFGNIRKEPISNLLNNNDIKSTRKNVRGYILERCKQCVCTLHVNSRKALLDAF